MAKLPMRCPFSGAMCRECSLFRGRHYYICMNSHYRGYIESGQSKIKDKSQIAIKENTDFDFDLLKKIGQGWSQKIG